MQTSNERQIRYVMYARKSSESEDRQVQSIEDQKKWLQEKTRQLKLGVVKTFTEERSAKRPDNRPIFEEMLQYLESGKADGIICWQINRLSRNPIDSARIQWMLQQGVIQSIVTNDKEYLPNDNAILLSVESGMANQFILELRANSIRGINSKAEKGWFPGMAPHGYLNDKVNDKGYKQIYVDEERWPYVRRLWDLMLTGSYNPRQALRVVTQEGLRTRKTRRQGGGPLTYSGVYRILTNIFYTGMFQFRGRLYEGSHKPMITLEEFDRVQKLLGAKGRPRPHSKEFSYTGLIRCGECGCLVTAETKTKFVKTSRETKDYTYYRCTKKKMGVRCAQSPIRLAELESQIMDGLVGLTITPEFRDWALRILEKENKRELNFRADKHRHLAKQVQIYEGELYSLNKTYVKGKLDDDFYLREKDSLKSQIAQARTELENSRDMTSSWIAFTEDIFKFACNAIETYASADVRTKRQMFAALGGDFVLTDKVLSYERAEWFNKIADEYPALEEQLKKVRTEKNAGLHLKIAAFIPILQTWGE